MVLFPRTERPSFGLLAAHHAAAAAELHGAAFAHGWSEVEFERLLAAETSRAAAAFAPRTGALDGFILSRVAGDEAEVLTIVVARRRRGRGLAGALLGRHLEELALCRIQALFLEVNENNAHACALYRRAGFAEVGRRKAYYPGVAGQARGDAIVLRRTLT